MAFDFKKNILLTGAGFTANFGTPLAEGMWDQIFNHRELKTAEKIRKLLLYSHNFESIYSHVLQISSDEYSESEKNVFKKVVKDVYKKLDNIVRNYSASGHDKIHYVNLSRFLGSFAGSNSGEKGAFFTLNQDLFIERQNGFKSPTVGKFANILQYKTTELNENDFIKLPSLNDIEEYKKTLFSSDGDFFYFKLHGSYGWLSVNGGDQMVLGEDKEEDIAKEPLLDWYNEIFKEVLFRDNVRLLIIGYGFNDDYINKILRTAVEKNKLKFYIISPTPSEKMLKKLQVKDVADGLDGYFCHTLSNLFPYGQTSSPLLDEILEIFPYRN